MTALVLVEHEGGAVKDATLAAVTAAAQLGAGPANGRRLRIGTDGRRRQKQHNILD